MKKRLTRGEKLLFASPLLFLALAGVVWLRPPMLPDALVLPDSHSVNRMNFSPDGKRLMALFQAPSATVPFGRVYDVESASVVSVLETPRSVINASNPWAMAQRYAWLDWSSDGTRVAANTFGDRMKSNRIAIWSADSGKLEGDYLYPPNKDTDKDGPLRFSTDGKTMIGEKNSRPVFEVATGKILKKAELLPNRNGNSRARLSAVNQQLGLGVVGNFNVVDSKTKRVVWSMPVANLINYNWSGDVLYIHHYTQYDNSSQPAIQQDLTLWDGRTRQILPSPPIRSGDVNLNLAFHPDGKTLVYSNGHATQNWLGKGFAGELVMWNYRENRILWRSKVSEVMGNLEWSPDGKWLATMAGHAPNIVCRVFDQNGNLRLKDKKVSYQYCFSPDSKKLANCIVEADEATNPKSHVEIHRLEE